MKLIVATAATLAAIGIAACAQDRFSEDDRDGLDLSNTQNLPGATENDDTLCSDGIDNDGDTLVDCADANCYPAFSPNGPTVCAVAAETDRDGMCFDGLDNDADGFEDCRDFDCENVPGCAENTDALCSDGVDNNRNGFVDCDDFSCSMSVTVTVCN